MPPIGSRLLPLLILFFLSGSSALVYQVLWMRLLALVFGVTVHAASTVLAAFMLGLAIGSAAAGRLADRVQRPLVVFAVAEALVAVAALATPLGLDGVEAIYIRLHGSLGEWPVAITLVRFLLSCAVLLVPTILMGATLPLVVKSSLAKGSILGRQVSLLYACNTAGAVVGTLIAGIWMVPQLGISQSFRAGAALNLIVAVGALLLAKFSAPQGSGSTVVAPEAGELPTSLEPAVPASLTVRRLVLLTFAISGFVSFALEIIWFRMLVILLRPTTYAFTVMLATVLAGIAIGSWLSTPLTGRRKVNLVAALAVLEVLLALAAAASMFVIGQANTIYGTVAPVFANTSLAYFGPMAVTSIVAIFPAALLMGMAFPVGIAIWTSEGGDARAGQRIGVIYAVNVAGAVAGSLASGFFLLPGIGSRASLLLTSGLALITGLLLLSQLQKRVMTLAGGVSALAAFGLLAWLTPDPVSELLRSRFPAERPVLRREDGQASVAILRRTSNFARTIHRLYINGTHQASDEPGMVAYHRFIGSLPVAVHPDPKKILVIGVGGGATAGAVAAFSSRIPIDIVELSPAVVDAARHFSGINQGLFERPNIHLRVDDGRNYMLLTPERYDIVMADVILPQHAGAGNLYSAEYYRLMRRVLNNRGIALQWVGSAGETEYKMIMRTFVSVFPHTTLWHGGTLMIGSTRPLILDEAAFLRKQAEPDSKQALDAIGFTSFRALLARYIAGPLELKTFLGEGPLLTDDRPLTEYFLALPQNDKPVDLSKLSGDVNRHVQWVKASPSGT